MVCWVIGFDFDGDGTIDTHHHWDGHYHFDGVHRLPWFGQVLTLTTDSTQRHDTTTPTTTTTETSNPVANLQSSHQEATPHSNETAEGVPEPSSQSVTGLLDDQDDRNQPERSRWFSHK